MRELVSLVGEPTRAMLEKALKFGTTVVALAIQDRERLLQALDDPQTPAPCELRGVLIRDHEWRRKYGLV